MARIKGQNTVPELRLQSALRSAGLKFALHPPTLAGRPDILFAGEKVAVFVDGCQWHGCPDHYVRPRTRQAFWLEKLAKNVLRDIRQTRELEGLGWRVVRIWEHQVFDGLPTVLRTIRKALGKESWRPRQSWRVIEVRNGRGLTRRSGS